jgi:adenine deaminase
MSKSSYSEIQSRYELTRVASGETDADIAIINAKIVNVYTGELLSGDTILIKADKIAYAGKYAKRGIGTKTKIIDATGKVLIPGFIDGHTHMDYICSSYETVRFAMKTGTTAIITEIAEFGFKLGYTGIVEYLKSIQNQPIKFWFTLPPMGTISPIARQHTLSLKEIRQLLKRKDCLGQGETYWGPVVAGDKQQLAVMNETLKAGKKIEGHSAGAIANKLQAYIALGISSDHEPITPEDALERLRLGLSVLIREGEVRRDMQAVSSIKDHKIDFRRLAMATDGIGPIQLTAQGFMDHLVQKAINLGFPPIQAIQMATLNVAEHFNLDDYIGGIAPGRFADIVMIPDVATIKPELVISNGRIVSQQGEINVEPRRHSYPKYAFESLRIDRKFSASDFSITTNSEEPSIKIRGIDQITSILTKEAIFGLVIKHGNIEMDIERDILKVAAIEHVYTPGKTFTGFIRGLGLKMGAVATSTCWDSGILTVAGASEADMAIAVNRIKELGGGTVVCQKGKVISELAFPIAGLISDEPAEYLAEKLKSIQKSAASIGCLSPDIRTTLSVLATPAIPYFRICESGFYNIRTNQIVDMVVEDEPD